MFMYSFLLFFGCLFISILLMSFVLLGLTNLFFNIVFLGWNGCYWTFNFNFDICTILILLMLSICFIYVYNYTGHYFVGDLAGIELNKIICLFVLVMGILVCTGDYLSTLILWEYLGVVSYFLILFYSSYLSLRSSIVTLVSSRFGDVSLFVLIVVSLYWECSPILSLILFYFVIFTKSAAFPFISWLLEAMRAPTPVSSLVHSSTLVAAGVWFCMRYDFLLYFSAPSLFSFLLLVTIFITGLCCFFFIDLKKIVALSTCNNISWCIFYLIFGDVILSLFQLVSHGVSKCLLFMLVGDVMSGSGGSQSSNCIYSPRFYGNWGVFSLFSIILGLSGVPFIGVFFTKHFLLSIFSNVVNITLFFILLVCVLLSYVYSFRFCCILGNNNSSISTGSLFFFNSGLIVYFWLIINFFIWYYLDEVSVTGWFISMNLLVFQLMALIISYRFYNSILLSWWSSSLFGCDNIVEYLYSLYSEALRSVNLFFYRWDNYTISLFSMVGNNILTIFTTNFLNIMVFSLLFLISCWCIVY